MGHQLNHKEIQGYEKKMQNKNLLKHLPEDIAAFHLKCPKCLTQFQPNWFNPLSKPLIPIKPQGCIWLFPLIFSLLLANEEFESQVSKKVLTSVLINLAKMKQLYIMPNDHDGTARLIPAKTEDEICCPSCEESVSVDLPIVKMRSKVMLFGDEAYREDNGKIIFTYSLVGADFKVLSKVEESLRKLKSELCPSESPDSWFFHMKELWSGDRRKNHRIFRGWSFEEVKLAVNHLFQLIQSHAEHLFIYNIALAGKKLMRGFTQQPARDEAYIILVMFVIHELTKVGGQPNLKFDAEKPVQADQVIQGWARDAFSERQHCLLYPFLAHGIEIPEPIFVQPASQPCLEIADFVSYIIARFYLKKWQGKEIEEILNPRNLGKVRYLGFDQTGDLVFHTLESYPWELFYGSQGLG